MSWIVTEEGELKSKIAYGPFDTKLRAERFVQVNAITDFEIKETRESKPVELDAQMVQYIMGAIQTVAYEGSFRGTPIGFSVIPQSNVRQRLLQHLRYDFPEIVNEFQVGKE